MYFAFDARTQELRESLLDFMDTHVHPNEKVFADQLAGLDDRWAWSTAPVLQELRAEARSRGLWNLFLPVGHYGDLGAGLTNLQYAPLAEITGRAGHLAPAALNCAAPDTGNMEVLLRYGTDEQRAQWLEPLLAGEIRSAFSGARSRVDAIDPADPAAVQRDLPAALEPLARLGGTTGPLDEVTGNPAIASAFRASTTCTDLTRSAEQARATPPPGAPAAAPNGPTGEGGSS